MHVDWFALLDAANCSLCAAIGAYQAVSGKKIKAAIFIGIAVFWFAARIATMPVTR